MTWYEKYYGYPPPVKSKLAKVLQEELIEKDEKKEMKESAWYRAKHDYLEYLRKQGKEGININAI
jgi:hypothetical protein